MTHEFLSDGWIAAANEIREKYSGQSTQVPPKVLMNQVITLNEIGQEFHKPTQPHNQHQPQTALGNPS